MLRRGWLPCPPAGFLARLARPLSTGQVFILMCSCSNNTHPADDAPALLPMLAAAVYIFLGHSVRAQRQALNDGVVRLAATAPSPSAAALYYEQRAPATVASSEAPAPAQGICANTCFKANDGVCDDGRFLHNMTRGLPSTVLCDLGTDCTDCGPWQGVQHSSAW